MPMNRMPLNKMPILMESYELDACELNAFVSLGGFECVHLFHKKMNINHAYFCNSPFNDRRLKSKAYF